MRNETHQEPTHTKDAHLLSLFSVNEQDYVRGMKRKDRGDLGKLLIHPSRAKPVPLALAMGMIFVFQTAQPALLYIVPCVNITVLCEFLVDGAEGGGNIL